MKALLYAHKVGLDIPTVLQKRLFGSRGKLVAFQPRDRESSTATLIPGFFVEHFLKDMKIALDEASTNEPCFARPRARLPTLQCGRGSRATQRDGTQTLILALAKLNGTDWKTRPVRVCIAIDEIDSCPTFDATPSGAMKAAFLTETGSPDVIQFGDLDEPDVGPGQVVDRRPKPFR